MPLPARLTGVCVLLVLVSCQTTGDGRPTHMTNRELARLIQIGTPPVIIDVRSGREYRRGHIQGALHVPFWQTFFRTDEIAVPRHRTVVVTCAHGPRAGIGRIALKRAGFANVVYLEGHMSGWYRAGLPVVTGEN